MKDVDRVIRTVERKADVKVVMGFIAGSGDSVAEHLSG
jgi:hypothetical protein